MLRGLRTAARTLAFALMAGLTGLGAVQAIDPGDGLKEGQDLVDRATQLIDEQVAQIRASAMDPATTYAGVNALVKFCDDFRDREVAARCRPDGPAGILIQDGIEDTLATRLHPLLEDYVLRNPDELLDTGRQAVELTFGRISLPPGRLLGFQLVHLMRLYGEQADTILAQPELKSLGVHDGYLRHVRDLAQVYAQTHATADEKYFCRLAQEDWIASRIVCEHCGHRGVVFGNQLTGVREDTTAVCREAFDPMRTDPETVLQRIRCRHWGHIFTAECRACGEKFEFTVPLPYFKHMQIQSATGALKDVAMPEERVIRY